MAVDLRQLLNPIRNRTLQQVLGGLTGTEQPELQDVTKTVIPTIVLNKEPLPYRQAFEIGNVFTGAATYRFDICSPTTPIIDDSARGRNFQQPLFDMRDLASFVLHRSLVFAYNSTGSAVNVSVAFGAYLSTNSPIVGAGGGDTVHIFKLTKSVATSTNILFFGANMDTGYANIPAPGQVINLENISNYFQGYWMEITTDGPVSVMANISIDLQPKATDQNNNLPVPYLVT